MPAKKKSGRGKAKVRVVGKPPPPVVAVVPRLAQEVAQRTPAARGSQVSTKYKEKALILRARKVLEGALRAVVPVRTGALRKSLKVTYVEATGWFVVSSPLPYFQEVADRTKFVIRAFRNVRDAMVNIMLRQAFVTW